MFSEIVGHMKNMVICLFVVVVVADVQRDRGSAAVQTPAHEEHGQLSLRRRARLQHAQLGNAFTSCPRVLVSSCPYVLVSLLCPSFSPSANTERNIPF